MISKERILLTEATLEKELTPAHEHSVVDKILILRGCQVNKKPPKPQFTSTLTHINIHFRHTDIYQGITSNVIDCSN